VFVYSGVYDELLNIDKSITVKGEDKENTIIRPDFSTTVTLNATYINFSGFTVTKNSSFLYGFWIASSHARIFNNIIIDHYPITIFNSSQNMIYDNIINVKNIGVNLKGNGNRFGYNTIRNNTITRSYGADETIGICVTESNNNIIESNHITGLYTGILIDNDHIGLAQNNTIINNTLIDNNCAIALTSIFVNHDNGTHTSIIGNIISDSFNGIAVVSDGYNIIRGNVISNCSWHGFVSEWGGPCMVIEDNTFYNDNIGLIMYDSQDFLIQHNIFSLNTRSGIISNLTYKIRIQFNIFEHNYYGIAINTTRNIRILSNTFLQNQDEHDIWLKLVILLTIRGNYWNASRILPKIIIGYYGFIWVDWRPVKEPYVIIPGMS
jgi:parallel beta-helix repeat protein